MYAIIIGLLANWGVYMLCASCLKILTITNLPWLGDYHRGCGVVSMPTYLRFHSILKNNNYINISHNYKELHRLHAQILQSQMGSTVFQSEPYVSPL